LTVVEAWVAVRVAAVLFEARVGVAVALLAVQVWTAAAAVWVAVQDAAGLAEWVLSAVALACSEVGQGAVAPSEVDPVWFQVDRACSAGWRAGFAVDWVWLPAGSV
jgi:hypothetical protein